MESKKVTIQDIADKANVSKSTVSRVLNNSTPVNDEKRLAVLEAMEAMNFKPNVFARGLAGGQSMTLGIVTQNFGSPIYDLVTQGIIRSLESTGYSPLFIDAQWQHDVAQVGIATLLGRQVDGLIMVGGSLTEQELDELKKRVPIIVVGRKVPDWGSQSIHIDNFKAAYNATNYLIEMGHREIAHITGIMTQPDAIHRQRGYLQALTDAGIDSSEELIYEGSFDSPSGVLAIESLLMRGRSFTAIFAANDATAYGARLGLYRRGIRVPEDVSIVGFDDQMESAFMTPPLTTVKQPAFEMGVIAGQAIVKLLNGQSFDVPELPVVLQVRESVARVRVAREG